ncbi:helix-turn-helix transcriptional regulator [Cohnella soli]|uniref:AraC family transcriptional regulator n=1 Tax=Cohnella soli TaxID=425005 RepID=A0ABW0HUU7_9BACL
MSDRASDFHATPSVANTFRTEQELRIELPFSPASSSIYYVGMNLHENWATSSHMHSHYELCYLDMGSGQYKIDKTVYEFGAGQFLLTRPGEDHFGLAGQNAPFKLYYVGFHVDLLSALQLDLYNIGETRIGEDSDGVIRSLFLSLIDEAQSAVRLTAPMAEALLQQMLIRVLRQFHDRESERHSSNQPLDRGLLMTMNRLHSEIRYDRDIDALAAAIPISRSQLARKFKSAIGVTIGEYMRDLVLSKAKSELRSTDKSVTLIAGELGFDSIHAFSIFFKRFTTHSPSEYRNMKQ